VTGKGDGQKPEKPGEAGEKPGEAGTEKPGGEAGRSREKPGQTDISRILPALTATAFFRLTGRPRSSRRPPKVGCLSANLRNVRLSRNPAIPAIPQSPAIPPANLAALSWLVSLGTESYCEHGNH
jgi:hypothetical protein